MQPGQTICFFSVIIQVRQKGNSLKQISHKAICPKFAIKVSDLVAML
jgi:hypothetical protein